MPDIETIKHLLGYLITPPYSYYAAVAAGLFLVLLVIRGYRNAHRGVIPFKSQGGTIEIAPQTLRGVILYAVQGVDGIQKCSCRHFIKRGSIGVRVVIHLRANHSLRDVESTIKDRIRHSLADQFGMETVDPIHIRVARIVGKPTPQEHFTALAPATDTNSLNDTEESNGEAVQNEDTPNRNPLI